MASDTTRRAKYEAHLRSDLWQQQRQAAFQRWGKFCGACGVGDALHVHHLNYRNLVDCVPEDFMPLCQACHDTVHSIPELDHTARVFGDPMQKRQMVILRLHARTNPTVQIVEVRHPVSVISESKRTMLRLERRQLKRRKRIAEKRAHAAALVAVTSLKQYDTTGATKTLTQGDLMRLRTTKNAFTRQTVAALGLKWTELRKGWVNRLVGTTIPLVAYQRALAGRLVFKSPQRRIEEATAIKSNLSPMVFLHEEK